MQTYYRKSLFLFPKGRSSEIARYAAAGCSDCEKIDRGQSTMCRPEVSRSAQTKKSTQLCVHTLAYLAINASISARNMQSYAAISLISTRKVPRHGPDFRVTASLKSQCTLFTIGRAVDRPLYRCVYRGDRMCGCGHTTISVGDHRKGWCVPIV